MKNKAMSAAVFLAVVVAAFMAGRPDGISGVAGIAASQVSSVSGAVWGFLGEERTGWMDFARFCSWMILIICGVWGLIGIVCVYLDKDPFPSLVRHILDTTDSSLPVWAVICIPLTVPLEGVARLTCCVIGTIATTACAAVKGLMTFDLKRLIRR